MIGPKPAQFLRVGDRAQAEDRTFVVIGDAVLFHGMVEFAVRYDPPTEFSFYDTWSVAVDTEVVVLDEAAVSS